jgi:hypothetical protein
MRARSVLLVASMPKLLSLVVHFSQATRIRGSFEQNPNTPSPSCQAQIKFSMRSPCPDTASVLLSGGTANCIDCRTKLCRHLHVNSHHTGTPKSISTKNRDENNQRLYDSYPLPWWVYINPRRRFQLPTSCVGKNWPTGMNSEWRVGPQNFRLQPGGGHRP